MKFLISAPWITILLISLNGWAQAHRAIDFSPVRQSPRGFDVVISQALTREPQLAFRKVNRFTPLLADSEKISPSGRVLIAGSANFGLKAFDPVSLRELWSFPIRGGVEAPGLIRGGLLFVGGNDGRFYSIDIETGLPVWSFTTQSENLSEPILESGLIYFLAGNNVFYALDALTGKQIWVYSRPEPVSLTIRGGSRPALSFGVVFVGFSDGSLVALNAKNGSPLWEQQISRALRFRDVDSEILVEGNLVYSLNFGEGAYAFRARTGERVWHHEVGGFGGFLNLGDELCYSSVSSEVVCVEKLSGRLKRQMGGLLGVGTTPIIAGKHWLVGESLGSLLFIRPSDLKIERRFDPGRGISSKPFFDVETNTVFFMSNEGNLYGLRLAEGLKAKEDVKR